LDFDAQKYAIDLALKLILYKKVKVVFFEDSRDVNDLGKKAVLRKVYRTRYTTYQELIKLKNLHRFSQCAICLHTTRAGYLP